MHSCIRIFLIRTCRIRAVVHSSVEGCPLGVARRLGHLDIWIRATYHAQVHIRGAFSPRDAAQSDPGRKVRSEFGSGRGVAQRRAAPARVLDERPNPGTANRATLLGHTEGGKSRLSVSWVVRARVATSRGQV